MATGLDTNILCYCLDASYPEHEDVKDLLLQLSPFKRVAINPTILHETYHTLVFSQKFVPSDARRRLQLLIRHPYIDFHNQTKTTCLIALNLAERHGLGGRDALIIANYLGSGVETMYTHDDELLSLGPVKWKSRTLGFIDPTVKENR